MRKKPALHIIYTQTKTSVDLWPKNPGFASPPCHCACFCPSSYAISISRSRVGNPVILDLFAGSCPTLLAATNITSLLMALSLLDLLTLPPTPHPLQLPHQRCGNSPISTTIGRAIDVIITDSPHEDTVQLLPTNWTPPFEFTPPPDTRLAKIFKP